MASSISIASDLGKANVRRNFAGNRAAFAELLQRCGFRLRGARADCAYCEGRSRLTVAVGEGVAYCHRCHWTGNNRTLSRKLGIPLAPETAEQRKRHAAAKNFSEWRGICQRILDLQFRFLARKASQARDVLALFPECDAAWSALKNFYDSEAQLCGALDMLSYEKLSQWLGQPMSNDRLFRAFVEGEALLARHNQALG
jgi:hypothetical protein